MELLLSAEASRAGLVTPWFAKRAGAAAEFRDVRQTHRLVPTAVTISPYLASLRAKVGRDLLLLPAVAVLVRDPKGRLLFVRDRESESWGLPAGAIEPSESPIEAARRELREETGVDCGNLELVEGLGGVEFRHTYPNGDAAEYSIFVYRCSASEDALPDPQDVKEVAEARFFSREDAPSLGLPYPIDVLWPASV